MSGIIMVKNEENKLVLTRVQTRWRVYIGYGKLNAATCKDHFPLPFIDQKLERLSKWSLSFTVYDDYFDRCLDNLTLVLKKCIDTSLVLCWKIFHFIVNQGILLRHVISERGIEVGKSKIDPIHFLPPLINVRDVCSFLGHTGFYHRFIKDL